LKFPGLGCSRTLLSLFALHLFSQKTTPLAFIAFDRPLLAKLCDNKIPIHLKTKLNKVLVENLRQADSYKQYGY
jgi:hypothetical protein